MEAATLPTSKASTVPPPFVPHAGQEYVDLQECCGWLRVSPSTIRGHIRSHKFPHIRQGRKFIFSVKAVRQWLERRAVN